MTARQESNPLVRVSLVLIFAAYAAGRVLSALPALARPRDLADTDAYLRISRQPIFDPDFWGSTRPFVFPLLLKVTQQDLQLAAAIQLGLSILAWSFLAWMITRTIRTSGLQIPAFVLILAFSLDRHIAGWDFVMMTESLSLSIWAVFIGLCIWLMEAWHPVKVAGIVLAGFLLVFIRDTNAWILLLFGGLIAAAVLLRFMQTRSLILSICFLGLFAINQINADMGFRWVFPLGNLIGKRVLPYGAPMQFFTDCGMPVSPALIKLAGQFANTQERAMFEDPELETFRAWMMSSARACYMRWLVADPVHSLGEVFTKFDEMAAFHEVDGYFSRAYDPLMPVVIGRFFYPERSSMLIWVITTLAAAAAVWRRYWKENHLWGAFIFINLLVFPHLYLAWHGDAMAPDRHALVAGMQLYLSFWLLVLVSLDKVRERRDKVTPQT